MAKIGVDNRRKNRKQRIKTVKIKAKQLFDKSFPNPIVIPSDMTFNNKWQVYLDDIGKAFGALREYRIAFNYGVKAVGEFNKTYQWDIQPPSHLVTNRPKAQLRTLPWLQRAWQVHAHFSKWHQELINGSIPDNAKNAYRNLILSFIFHSGHCLPDVVKAFSQQMLVTPFELKAWNEQPFIALTIQNPSFNTNVSEDKGVFTQFCCYLHPLTLGLMRIWETWQKIADISSFPNWNTLLPFLVEKHNLMTIVQYCSAAAYTCEQHDGVELSQALVEYQIGRNKSYSIPLDNLARLGDPTVARIKQTPLNLNTLTSKPINSIAQDKKQPATYASIKTCFQKKGVKELTKAELMLRLDTLVQTLNAKKQTDILVLVCWYRYKLKTCAVSSIRSYHANLSRSWLYLCSMYPLHQLNSDNLESVYSLAIEGQTTTKAKQYFASRLKDLHQFAVNSFNFAKISSQFLHIDPTQSHTRAGFIDESLFTALIHSINHIAELNLADRLCLKALCIASYRCGLRFGELRKLRIKDIEKSQIGWLQIRDSQYGRNKTASSLRKVPFFPLLLNHEKEIVDRYYRLKLEQTGEQATCPFFTLGSETKLPIESLQISTLIGRLLKSLSGLDYVVFHHLRHSCLSKLQLILELKDKLRNYPQLIAYSPEQINKIHQLIFGETSRNGYDQIAAFAGHESAEMTFQHYFHFSDWIVSKKLLDADFKLTNAQTVRLRINSRANIRQNNHSDIYTDSLRYLSQKLKVTKLNNSIIDGCAPVTDDNISNQEIISIPICYSAVQLYEQGFQQEDICNRFRIKQHTLCKWIENAKAIKTLSINNVGTVTSRHFSDIRSHRLLPAKLKSKQDIIQLEQYITKLKRHYPANREAFKTAVAYALNNGCTSKSGIYFNSPKELQTFLDTFGFVIPKSHWRAMTHFLNGSRTRGQWKQSLKGMKQIVERKQAGRNKISQGAVRLELIAPKSRMKEHKTGQKQSSPILMYLFHMMAIMMPIL